MYYKKTRFNFVTTKIPDCSTTLNDWSRFNHWNGQEWDWNWRYYSWAYKSYI